MIVRSFLFLFLVIVVLNAPVWLTVLCFIVYGFVYTAYELLVLAACVDALYGTPTFYILVPLYTLSTLLGLIFIEWMKPQLSVYNQ